MNAPLSAHPIFILSDELTRALAELMPVAATYIGLPGHDHRWEDLSPAGHDQRAAVFSGFRRRLAALDAGTDPWLTLAKATLADQLDQWLEAHEQRDHLLDLNSIDCPFQNMRMVFDVMDTSTAAGWENVAARLEGLGSALAGYRALLAEGLAQGRAVARRQVEAVLEQARVHAGDTSYFATLPATAPEAIRARIDAGARSARAGIAAFADWLRQEYAPRAVARDAVGPERYARAAARHLGMKLDAREAYAWGWDEVRRLEAAMRQTARAIDAGAAVPALVQRLKHAPEGCASGPAHFLELMMERQQRAVEKLDGVHFAVPPPARRIEVKLAPPGSVLGAYYTAPSEDFSRAGCVWYVLGETQAPPLFTEISVAYHEGFPGHHLQIATQMHLGEKLSRFQRVVAGNTGYAEGWALYAEQLMFELGYLERPEYELGMQLEQLVRAYRVVVDIGLHLELPVPAEAALGAAWTFETMLEAMHARSFLPRDHAESEVTRYMGWPAQAIAYKLGQRAILKLREERRRAQGSAFSLAGFHQAVLEVGSVGLDLLAERLRA